MKKIYLVISDEYDRFWIEGNTIQSVDGDCYPISDELKKLLISELFDRDRCIQDWMDKNPNWFDIPYPTNDELINDPH